MVAVVAVVAVVASAASAVFIDKRIRRLFAEERNASEARLPGLFAEERNASKARLLGQLAPPLLRNPRRRADLHALLESAIIGIYLEGKPVCTAVFISPSRALTVYHDARPELGSVLHARSTSSGVIKRWRFTVSGVSASDDLVVLDLVEGPAPAKYLRIQDTHASISAVALMDVAIATTFGIAAASHGGGARDSAGVGLAFHSTTVTAHGRRHFVYATSAGRGSAGGAVVSLDAQLVGLHLGDWHRPESPPPSAGSGGRAKYGTSDDAGPGPSAPEATLLRQRRAASGLQHAVFLTQALVDRVCASASTSSGRGAASLSRSAGTGAASAGVGRGAASAARSAADASGDSASHSARRRTRAASSARVSP